MDLFLQASLSGMALGCVYALVALGFVLIYKATGCTDPEILRKVLMNLLGNAVKFTAAGSIALTVQPVDDRIELSVADTGVGIPPEDLPYIFEEFRQVERQGSPEIEGTGLGLAIARRSVELLGGEITCDSEVDRGTTFTLSIGEYRA